MLKKIAKILAIIISSAWIIFCASVYFLPELYFYNPSSEKANLDNALSNDFSAEEVKYNSYDNTELYGWFIKPKNNQIVVFFHGNQQFGRSASAHIGTKACRQATAFLIK